jgi:hypothetical protein
VHEPDGAVLASCQPQATRCLGAVSQICSASQTWQDNGTCGWTPIAVVDGVDKPINYGVFAGLDDADNANVVWTQGDIPWSIWSNHYQQGMGWGIAQPAVKENYQATWPDVAFARNGEVAVFWAAVNTQSGLPLPGGQLYARRRTAQGWGTIEPVAPPVVIDGGTRDLSSDFNAFMRIRTNNDNARVLWRGMPYGVSGHGIVWSSRWTTTGGWGPLEKVADDDWEGPDLAMRPDGTSLAVWISQKKLWSSEWTAASGWGAPKAISDGAGQPQYPLVRSDALGNAWVVWTETVNATNQSRASHAMAGGNWEPPITINDDTWGFAGLAVDAGEAVMMLQAADGRFASKSYVPGAGWGVPMPVPSSTGASHLAVAKSSINVVAVWTQPDGSLVASHLSTSATWGPPEPIAAAPAFAQSLQVLASGHAIVGGLNGASSSTDVWVSFFR